RRAGARRASQPRGARCLVACRGMGGAAAAAEIGGGGADGMRRNRGAEKMNGNRPTARSIALALAFLLAGTAAATAQPAAEFYKGKTVTSVIGSDVGGGYDAYGRLGARRLGAH